MLKDSDNESFFADDKLIENDSFAKKLLNAANTFYHKSDSNQSHKPCYLGNSVRTKRRKRQQQREAAKGTPTLLTFWNQNKTSEEADEMELSDDKVELSDVERLDEVDEDDTGGLSEDEIEISNWHKRISTALENIVLDIKNENSNSEVWYDQSMIFPLDYHIPELREEAKRLKQVLTERGLWSEKGLKLKEAQELMSKQPDFLAQKGQLEEIIIAARHQIVQRIHWIGVIDVVVTNVNE
ncbi:5043_t:CDS:2, partial [Gigaspora margarita]